MMVKVTVECGWGGFQAGKGHCRMWVGWVAGW